MKNILLLISIVFINISFSQDIDIGTYELKVKKVNFTSTVSGELGAEINFASGGNKYLVIKGIFSPKFKKNNSINITDFTFKTNNEEYKFQSPSTLTIDLHIERGNNQIKIRRPKKLRIVTTIPKKTSKGDVFFKDKKIGTITIKSKKATFIKAL